MTPRFTTPTSNGSPTALAVQAVEVLDRNAARLAEINKKLVDLAARLHGEVQRLRRRLKHRRRGRGE